MKSIAIAVLLLLSGACMQKGADGTYHFRASKAGVEKNTGALKADAKKLGRQIEKKSAEAADKASATLQRASDKLKERSDKRH